MGELSWRQMGLFLVTVSWSVPVVFAVPLWFALDALGIDLWGRGYLLGIPPMILACEAIGRRWSRPDPHDVSRARHRRWVIGTAAGTALALSGLALAWRSDAGLGVLLGVGAWWTAAVIVSLTALKAPPSLQAAQQRYGSCR